jgi:Family of unknown function (DUF6221)
MTGMDDLVTWFRTQLDDDERVAREAADGDSGRWFVGDKWNVYCAEDLTPDDDQESNELVVYGNFKDQSEHIARWDPARVLAEVDAKRRILDRLRDERGFYRDDIASGTAEPVIRLLALPLADRPGYLDEWRPDGS